MWVLCGVYVVSMWVLFESCLRFILVLCGSCVGVTMVFVRFFWVSSWVVFWVLVCFYSGFVWVLCWVLLEFYVGFIWVRFGFYLGSRYYVGFYVGSVLFGFCLVSSWALFGA